MKSLSTKFMLFISILLIVVCGSIGVVSYYFSSKSVIDEVNESLALLSREVTMTLKANIDNRINLLNALTNYEAIRDPEVPIEEKMQILNEEIEREGYLDLGIGELSGNLITRNGSSGVNIANEPYFIDALAGKPSVSDPKVSMVDNTVIMVYAVPIKSNDGEIIGVLTATRDGYELTNFTKSIDLGGSRDIFMVNKEGTSIANANPEMVKSMDNIFENAKVNPELAKFAELQMKMVAGEAGVGSYTYAGIKKYMGYSPVEGMDWFLAITAPEAEVLAGVDNLKRLISIGSFIFLILGIGAAYLFSRRITTPLQLLVEKIKEIGKGNLAENNIDLKTKDEVGVLNEELDNMLTGLRELVTNVANMSEQVASSSEELTSGAEQQARAAGDVANAVSNLALGAESQSGQVEEITTSIEEFIATIEQLAATSNLVAQQTEGTASASAEGQKTALLAVEQMKSIDNVSAQVQEAVDRLAISSNEINDINNVISGIADQTNLLALNAAIEAARAGEQGRGFAVVAEEVRKLAEQSQAAAKQISERLDQNQANIEDAVTAMGLSSKNIETGIEVVNAAGHVFEDIDKLMNEVSSQVAEISIAIQQLAQGSQGIAQAARNLDDIAKESEASTQTVSAATEEQTASIEEIAASSQHLAAMAENLQSSLSRFRV